MENRFGVISADGHCRLMHLPFDLWTTRLSKKFQDTGPSVVQRPDGTRQWVVEGHPWSGVGWSGVGGAPSTAIPGPGWRRSRSPESSAPPMPGIAAKIWTGMGWM